MITDLNIINLNDDKLITLNIIGIKKSETIVIDTNNWLWDDETPIFWDNESIILIE